MVNNSEITNTLAQNCTSEFRFIAFRYQTLKSDSYISYLVQLQVWVGAKHDKLEQFYSLVSLSI